MCEPEKRSSPFPLPIQGLFIFIFHCMSDSNVRLAVKAKIAGEKLSFTTSSGGSRRVVRRAGSKMTSSSASGETGSSSAGAFSVSSPDRKASLVLSDLNGKAPRGSEIVPTGASSGGDKPRRETENYLEVVVRGAWLGRAEGQGVWVCPTQRARSRATVFFFICLPGQLLSVSPSTFLLKELMCNRDLVDIMMIFNFYHFII